MACSMEQRFSLALSDALCTKLCKCPRFLLKLRLSKMTYGLLSTFFMPDLQWPQSVLVGANDCITGLVWRHFYYLPLHIHQVLLSDPTKRKNFANLSADTARQGAFA